MTHAHPNSGVSAMAPNSGYTNMCKYIICFLYICTNALLFVGGGDIDCVWVIYMCGRGGKGVVGESMPKARHI